MTSWGSPPKKKEGPDETDYVAEGQNWEQRIKSEQEASDAWYPMWGSVYANKNQAPNNQIRLQQVKNELKTLYGVEGGTSNKENKLNNDYDFGLTCESLTNNRSSNTSDIPRVGGGMLTNTTTMQASYGQIPKPYEDHLGKMYHRTSCMKTMGEGNNIDYDELDELERMEQGRK